MDKAYGEGMYYISKVDIWKDKLRLVVKDSTTRGMRLIVMEPKDAQEVVNDIWFTVQDYQNTLRKEIVNEER